MRSITLVMVALLATSFSACSTYGSDRLERTVRTDSCPELEGYPDCQGGQRVDTTAQGQPSALAHEVRLGIP
jgi:hypothetical protein